MNQESQTTIAYTRALTYTHTCRLPDGSVTKVYLDRRLVGANTWLGSELKDGDFGVLRINDWLFFYTYEVDEEGNNCSLNEEVKSNLMNVVLAVLAGTTEEGPPVRLLGHEAVNETVGSEEQGLVGVAQ